MQEKKSPEGNIQENENKLSSEENKNIVSIFNASNGPLGGQNDSDTSMDKELKNVYISNWLICCFMCTSRKRNLNKILFEEGSKLITQRLEIMNMFNELHLIEVIRKKLGIEEKGLNMSDRCKDHLQIYNMNNNYKTIEN